MTVVVRGYVEPEPKDAAEVRPRERGQLRRLERHDLTEVIRPT